MRALADLSKWVEEEAAEAGPEAVAELEAYRAHYRLACQIAEERRKLHLTQPQLAKLSGIPQSEISKIETGRANSTAATLTVLLRAMGKELAVVNSSSALRRLARPQKVSAARRVRRMGSKG
jgi:DNA-binding transcriptional regulator YiaG